MSKAIHDAPLTTDTRKKRPALPSILSNLRNAQAAIGRTSDDRQDHREIRSLVGGGTGANGNDGTSNVRGTTHSTMKRSAMGMPRKSSNGNLSRHAGPIDNSSTSSLQRGANPSLVATFQNFSTRFGSQWRKHHRDTTDASGKKYKVSFSPQKFLVYFGCFFIGAPLLLLLYLLARQAVFGDEGVNMGIEEHKYEVPSFVSNGKLVSGKGESQPGEEIFGEISQHDMAKNLFQGNSSNVASETEVFSIAQTEGHELGLHAEAINNEPVDTSTVGNEGTLSSETNIKGDGIGRTGNLRGSSERISDIPGVEEENQAEDDGVHESTGMIDMKNLQNDVNNDQAKPSKLEKNPREDLIAEETPEYLEGIRKND